MFQIKKKTGKRVTAYRLGEPSEVLDALMESGKVKPLPDGTYEIFSQEAVNGHGEVAQPGDYIKLSFIFPGVF